ncbi:MAG: nucleotide pyrophosphohydrolase [Dehalococcoidia bacterium]|nr:nucleotide pyrophosphohydrolase [Dehalococcoidia bacterium]
MAEPAPSSDDRTTIGDLKRLIQEFVDERDWGKYHNSKDIAIAINVEAGELLELFEWVREADIPDLLEDTEKRRRVGEEMADVVMLCLNFASVAGFDVAETVGRKMARNKAKYPVELVKGNYRKYTELRSHKAAPDHI